MNIMTMAVAAAAITLVSASPALAGHHPNSGSPSGSGGATSVPEPTDAVLLLMGAAGVIIGRRLHARKNRD